MPRIRCFCWGAFLLVGGILFPGRGVYTQELVHDSLSAPMVAAIARLTSPELEERIVRRREMQRKGYADVLFHTLRHDGLWGLLASARSHLQLEYSLPRQPLVIYVPIRQPEPRDPGLPGFTGAPSPPVAIPLPEERRFPEDPWAKR